MAKLSNIEKERLENALRMGDGYVLNFSDRTFAAFFEEFGIKIYDEDQYPTDGWSTSKANRMRAFWKYADDYTVGKILMKLFDNWDWYGKDQSGKKLPSPSEKCISVAKRLMAGDSPARIPLPDTEDKIIAALTDSVNKAVESGRPEESLDRLHALMVRYSRILCKKRKISVQKDEPLHSVWGKYVKYLRDDWHLNSKMTERIMKTSISLLDAFNGVRNDQSYAHANSPLNRRESEFIVRTIDNLIRFVSALEKEVDKFEKEMEEMHKDLNDSLGG